MIYVKLLLAVSRLVGCKGRTEKKALALNVAELGGILDNTNGPLSPARSNHRTHSKEYP